MPTQPPTRTNNSPATALVDLSALKVEIVREVVTTLLPMLTEPIARSLSAALSSIEIPAAQVTVEAPVTVSPQEVRVNVPEMQVKVVDERDDLSQVIALLQRILNEVSKPEIIDVNRSDEGWITRAVKHR